MTKPIEQSALDRMVNFYNLMRDAVAWADSHEVEHKLGHTPQWLISARGALARECADTEQRGDL